MNTVALASEAIDPLDVSINGAAHASLAPGQKTLLRLSPKALSGEACDGGPAVCGSMTYLVKVFRNGQLKWSGLVPRSDSPIVIGGTSDVSVSIDHEPYPSLIEEMSSTGGSSSDSTWIWIIIGVIFVIVLIVWLALRRRRR